MECLQFDKPDISRLLILQNTVPNVPYNNENVVKNVYTCRITLHIELSKR